MDELPPNIQAEVNYLHSDVEKINCICAFLTAVMATMEDVVVEIILRERSYIEKFRMLKGYVEARNQGNANNDAWVQEN